MKVLDRKEAYNLALVYAAAKADGDPERRWQCMFYNPDAPDDNRQWWLFRAAGTTAAQKKVACDEYNGSIFSLTLPQGTQADERVGAEVQVLKDKWLFSFYCPNHDPQTEPPANATASTMHQRPIKIRLVCVYQDKLLEPGNIGFMAREMFDDTDHRLSHFKRGDAQGYKVLYDKTRTFTPKGALTDYSTSLPLQATFAANFSYPRRYAQAVTDLAAGGGGSTQGGNVLGTEVTYDVATGGTTLTGGTLKGQLLWYVFVDDKHAARDTAVGSQSHYPEYGYTMRVDRRTYWTDV